MFFTNLWSSLSRKSALRTVFRRDRRRRFLSVEGSAGRALRVERLEDRALMAADLDLTKTFTFAAGGDVNGSNTFNPGDTILYTVTVANVGNVDLTGVTFDDLIDANTTLGQVNVSPLARNDSFNAVGNTLLRVGGSAGTGPEVFVAGGSVTSNDAEFLGDTFTLTPIVNGATTLGGTVNLAADGTFTYISQAGDTGTDSFQYTITDGGLDHNPATTGDNLSSTGTVSIVLTGTIWYVNNSGANGNGTSTSPFNTLTGAQTSSVAGDTIFVHTGSGPYTTGITLKNNQTLWGQGSALTATLPAGTPTGTVTLLAAGTDPTFTNAAGAGVTLAQNNTLLGFTVGDTTTADIIDGGGTVGALTVSNVILQGTGTALNIDQGGTLNVTIDKLTVTSATGNGVRLGATGATLTGSVTINDATSSIAGTGGAAFLVGDGAGGASTGGAAAISYAGTITATGANRNVDIQDRVAGAGNITFSGTLTHTTGAGTAILLDDNAGGTILFSAANSAFNTSTSTAISLTDNTNTTINFTGGGLDIDTTSGTGFLATGGGTTSVQGTNNTITSTSGTALNVANTTISSNHLTFKSIASGSGANSSATGIILDTTGANGGLHVTGTGSAGGGGTIQHKTGADGSTSQGIGIYLNSTSGVQLADMQLNDFQNFGIRGFGVSGLTLSNVTVNTTSGFNGTDPAFDEGSIAFDNLNGTVSVTNSTFSDAQEADFKVINTSGNLNITVIGSTFSDNSSTDGLQGLLLQAGVNAGDTPDITANITTSHFTGNRARDIQAISNGAATMTINIGQNGVAGSGGTFDGMPAAMIDLAHNSTGNHNFNIQRATFTIAGVGASVPINIFNGTASGSGSTFQGRVVQNSITGQNNSGFDGISMTGSGPGTMTVLVDNNTVTNVAANGINYTGAQNSATNHTNLTITNNTITMPDPNAAFGIQVSAQASPTATAVVEALISGNNVVNNTASPDYRIDARFGGATLQMPGYLGGSDTNNAKAFVAANNKTNGVTSTSAEVSASLGIGNVGHFANTPGGAAVPLPSNPQPLFFAPSLPEPPADEGTPSVVLPPVIDDPGTQPPVIVDDGILSLDELSLLVGAAIARWEATGLTAAQDALLHSVTFSVEDLPGWYLGAAGAGRVTLDVNAAGNSWFVDPTPEEDSEYSMVGTAGQASSGTLAAGRVDALTTVMHELGHQIGLDDIYNASASANLMYGFIHLSERRLPAAGQAEGAVPHLVGSGVEFLDVGVPIGSLPTLKSVTIQFTAQINLNTTAATITNQGSAFSDQGGLAGTMASPILSNQTTITVDFPNVTVALGATTSVAEDSGGNLIYTFTREAPLTNALTANFTVSGGAVFTGDATTDYTQTGAATFGATSGTVTFAAGSATATVTITPMADTAVEPDETVVLTVASGAGYDVGVPSAATGTIVNDDTSVSVAVSPASVNEDGTTNLVYTFTRAGVTTNSLTVNFSLTGTADATNDHAVSGTEVSFTPGTGLGTITFAANDLTKTMTVDPTADNTVESDETVIATVTSGTGYNVSGSAANATITNDDSTVTIAVSPASVAEDGAPNLVYTLTRTGFLTNALTVNFGVGGTATFGGGSADYTQTGAASFTSSTGTATFLANANTVTITVDPTTDANAEPDETVILTVSANGAPATTGGYAVGAPGAATGTILDDDTSVSVVVSSASVLEDGSTNLVYTFTRVGQTAGALTVNFGVGGGATFNTDYTASSSDTPFTFTAGTGTVTIADGLTTASVTLDPTVDTDVEPDETAVLTVASGAGYVPTGSPATATITNDDTSVFVSGTPGSVAEDSGSGLTYTFKRSGLITNAMTVNLTVGGSAAFTTDYTQSGAATFDATSATLLFAANSDTAVITLTPVADTDVEPDETATLTIASGTGYSVDPVFNSLTGTITNDDATVSVAVSPSSIAEDAANGNFLTYTFTRSGFLANALTVNFTASGSATKDIDYSVNGASFIGLAGTVTFAPNAATATVTVDPTADATGEPDETVIFTVDSGMGYTPGTGGTDTASGTILDDDTSVSVSVSPAAAPETGATDMIYTFTRTGDISQPLTVNFSAGGSASFTNDYSLTGADTYSSQTGLGTITIAAGDNDATVTLTPSNDTLVEGDETAAIFVNTGAGYGVGTSPAVGTITDNDTAAISFVAATSNAPEGTATHTVGVKLTTFSPEGTASLQNDFTVDVSDLGGGTAVGGGVDYTLTTASVTFSAGDTGSTQNVSAAIVNDLLSEGSETFSLGLAASSVNTAVTVSSTPHVVTIVDNDVDLKVTVAGPSGTVVAGSGAGNLSFTITVQNAGLTDATNLNIGETFTLPAGVHFASAAPSTGAFTGDDTGGTWTFGALAVSGSATLTVNFTADHTTANGATATVGATASSADQTLVNTGDDTNSANATITRQSDLSIVKTDSPDPVGPGTQLTYTIVVSNSGPSDNTSATVTDMFPAGLSSVTWTAVFTTGGTGNTSGSGNISETVSIPAGGNVTYTVHGTVTAAANTSISNTASLTSSEDTNVNNNSDSESTFIGGVDLKITKAGDVALPTPGQVIKYTLSYRNGGFITAAGVNITDVVPSNTVFDAADSTAGWTGVVDGSGAGTTATFPVGSLPVSPTNATVIFAVRVIDVVPAGANTIDNSANISDNGAAGADLTPSDNSASASTTLDAAPDLTLSKTDGGISVEPGDTVSYTLTYANVGNQDSVNMTITETVPANSSFNSAGSNPGWSQTGPSTYKFDIASLPGGAQGTVVFAVTVNNPFPPATTEIINAATIDDGGANGPDPTPANNAATDTTPVNTFDFGDAPETYGTSLPNGARHKAIGPMLGTLRDVEHTAQQPLNGTGDDAAGTDDEDGVTLPTTIVAGLGVTANIVASGSGKLDAWVDFDRNGVFDANEQITASLPLVAGNNSVVFTVPITSVGGGSYARFRFSSTGGLAPTGQAADGEVEDYTVQIVSPSQGSASLVADPQNPGQTVLDIVGTSGNDVLIVEPRPSNMTQIRAKNTGKLLGIFPSSAFQRIVVFGLGGNDTIVVDSRIAKPAELHGNGGNDTLVGGSRSDVLFGEDGNDKLYGNAGNDSLFGGAGNDSLYGGTGSDKLYGEAGNDALYGDGGYDLLLGGADNDKLYGGAGRDVLIGGLGQDKLYGQQDDDILIGGTTAHDNNDVALNSIVAEWSSSHSFSTRIANLGGLLNPGTVNDDGSRDTLNGDGGRDWFLDFLLADSISGFNSNPTKGDRKN